MLRRFVREEEGQDLIEYALLAGFISLVAVIAITNVGTSLNTLYNTVDAQVQDAGS
jgi:pilus assembly protein Flp/PilA